jgi:hypothetical protein
MIKKKLQIFSHGKIPKTKGHIFCLFFSQLYSTVNHSFLKRSRDRFLSVPSGHRLSFVSKNSLPFPKIPYQFYRSLPFHVVLYRLDRLFTMMLWTITLKVRSGKERLGNGRLFFETERRRNGHVNVSKMKDFLNLKNKTNIKF